MPVISMVMWFSDFLTVENRLKKSYLVTDGVADLRMGF